MKQLTRYRKTLLALVGAAATWAVSTFPDNHQVQIIGGLVAVLLTAGTVYQVPNTPPAGEPSDPTVSETGPTD